MINHNREEVTKISFDGNITFENFAYKYDLVLVIKKENNGQFHARFEDVEIKDKQS